MGGRRILAGIVAIACLLPLVQAHCQVAQSHSAAAVIAPDKPQQVKAGSLIEVVSDAPAAALVDWVVIEPIDCDYRTYESGRVFVTTAQSRTGTVKVLEIVYAPGADGKPSLVKRIRSFAFGPPAPLPPVVLPTAKLTASPTRLDAKAPAPVHLEWTTAPEGVKVTLNDGNGPKDVDSNGSAVVLPRITTLYTIAATTADGSVAYSQAIVTVSDDPPPPVVDTKSLVSIVYESSEMPVPRQVHNARFELEAKGFEVRVVDADVVTGLGTIPTHMKAAIEAARSQGLPCLVITSGDKVIRKLALPATDAEIVRAVTQ